MEYVLGIDLGTTNTCVYYQDPQGNFKVLPIDNEHLLPSMVSFKGGSILIGQKAMNQRLTTPKTTIFAFKRLMGRRWESQFLQNAIKHYSYKVVQCDDGTVRIQCGSDIYSVEEISSYLLRKIKEEAERYFSKEITKAVITVPAYFNENQRKSTKDAGKIAGLEVIRIINEPTAAALAYGFKKERDQRILVYDLGGGTFDVTILEITDDVFEVIATAGDTFLGGEDFTNRIVDWIVRDIHKSYDDTFDLYSDASIHQRIKEMAETAKRELSIRNIYNIELPFLFIDRAKQTINYSNILTRDDLEDLIEPIVNQTIDLVNQVLTHIEMTSDDIDEVLLIGGQTRMPLIQDKLFELFKKDSSKGINPDEAVAMGAAIQGSLLVNKKFNSLLLDVISQSMGIMISGGFYEKIIEQGSVIPCSAEKIFTTIRDNQETVEINIFQGEHYRSEANTYLGTIKITDIPPLPQGEFKVNVKFIVNSEGILKVEATNLETQETYNLIIEGTSGLSPEEIEKLIQKNQLVYSSGDRKQELIELIIAIKELIPKSKTLLEQMGKPGDKIENYRLYIEKLESLSPIPEHEYDRYLKTLQSIRDGLNQLFESTR